MPVADPPARTPSLGGSGVRRLLPLVAAIAVLDSMFFAAITPLLPHYATALGLSKSAAGVLSAAYAAGTVLGSLPGGWLAARLGVRQTLLLGLSLLALSSFGFAFAENIVLLDLARFLQGVGAAFSWAAGLAWLAAAAPQERRGEMIGTAFAAAFAGVVLGPALGGAASALGPKPVFSSVGLVGIGLAAWTGMVRAPTPPQSRPDLGLFRRSLRRPEILLGIWLTAVPSLFEGALAVLAPLRLGALGAGGVAIGAVFFIAGGMEAVATWLLGASSDRRGRLAPIRIGLGVLAISAVALPLPGAVLPLSALIVVTLVGFGFIWAPAGALLSEAGEEAGIELSFAFALFMLAWAAGQVVGGAGGAGLAELTSDAVPYLMAAGLCLATLFTISGSRTAGLLKPSYRPARVDE